MTQQQLISHQAVIRAWPGRSAAVGEALKRLVAATRPLPGCLSIAVSRQADDLRAWQLNICWADNSAMAAWLEVPVADLFTALVAQHLVMHIDIQPGTALFGDAELRRAG